MTALRRRLALPTGVGRTAVLAAAAAWIGALLGGAGGIGPWVGLAVAVAAGAVKRRFVVFVLVAAAVVSGWLAMSRAETTLTSELEDGPVKVRGTVADEPVPSGGGIVFLFRPECRVEGDECVAVALPPLGVETESTHPVTVRDLVEVAGRLRPRPGRIRGDPVAARVVDAEVTLLPGRPNPLFAVGNALRSHVVRRLDEQSSRSAALMAGLLIGDTSKMNDDDLDALRRSGLTHYVAVSGSNVALFLVAWWLIWAPLLADPRLRSLWGLVGLALFVVVTRWEASVVRASTMAGLVLVGRALAMPIDAWTALSTATVGLLLFSGDLAANVGFQLSVAATAGVLAGARLFTGRRPRMVWAALGATAAAQVAVTPLLLLHFGTVPLLSPLANVLAAPLVVVATALGGVGALTGIDPILQLGLIAASGVLMVAATAADWPQLGWAEVALLLGLGLLLRYPLMRPAAVVVVVAMMLPASGSYRPPAAAVVTVLDVGQGDAILIQGVGGEVMLIDGGRDPRILRDKLRDRNISHIDILVVSHGDADHIGGLDGLVERATVGRIWVPAQPQREQAMIDLLARATAVGIPVRWVDAPGDSRLGEFGVSIMGPTRRYAGENDGSIVLVLEAGGRSMLLAGDIEAVAQNEIEPPNVDILLVPHHGSSTSDLDWLRAVAPSQALISVGFNGYGHPSATVLAALRDSGATILTTRETGDIVVPFP